MSDDGRTVLTTWKPLDNAGALIGFATVKLPCTLSLIDCPVFAKDGQVWATLPQKVAVNREGKAVIVNGKKVYERVAKWPDRATDDRFSKLVIDLVRKRDPTIFDKLATDIIKGR